MSKAIFQIAHTLKIDLPSVRRTPSTANVVSSSMCQSGASIIVSSRQRSLHATGCEVCNLLVSGNTMSACVIYTFT